MVDVAQLVEPRIVIPAVVGSSPIVHPNLERSASRAGPSLIQSPDKGASTRVVVSGITRHLATSSCTRESR